MKLRRFRSNTPSKSQSLVELAIILPILMILMSGVIEFGNLLNQYINLVDGAREGARFASDKDPFTHPTGGGQGENLTFYNGIDEIVEGQFAGTVQLTKGAIAPISLDSTLGDDVVISVFSILNGTVTRFPFGTNGWSKYDNQTSKFTDAQLAARLDPSAPDTGMVLVEIYYNYSQILKMPFFTMFIADPIAVHTFSIMPLSAAEPTPTPKP